MTFKNKYLIILAIWLPLILGGLIYISFRPTSLIMFGWIKFFKLSFIVVSLNEFFSYFAFPSWVIYNLPNALWTFSFTLLMIYIWRHERNTKSIFWISIPPVISILIEIGQGFHFINGTFDLKDLFLILIASLIPFLIRYRLLAVKKWKKIKLTGTYFRFYQWYFS